MASSSSFSLCSSTKSGSLASPPSQNVQHLLRDREIQWKRPDLNRQWAHQQHEREILKTMTPNLSVNNVDNALGRIPKFTPNGRQLISVSKNHSTLQIFDYHGLAKLGDMLQNVKSEQISSHTKSSENIQIRKTMFDKLFTLRSCIPLFPPHSFECVFSTFIDDGKCMLLVAENEFNFDWDFGNACAIITYTIYVIHLKTMCATSMPSIKKESIALAHNHGVSVYGCTVAFLYYRSQTIAIFKCKDGKLKNVSTVDCSNEPDLERIDFENAPPSTMKKKILYKILRMKSIKELHKNINFYKQMKMRRIRLMDNDTICIKYVLPCSGGMVNANKFELFVLYSISAETVIKVFEECSTEVKGILGQPSSSNNSAYFPLEINSTLKASGRFNHGPYIFQSVTNSPYLDYNRFKYSDRFISEVCFKDRKTNATKFRILIDKKADSTWKGFCHVDFIFHPYEPFIISIEPKQIPDIVHFHVYNRSTIVKQ